MAVHHPPNLKKQLARRLSELMSEDRKNIKSNKHRNMRDTRIISETKLIQNKK